MHRILVIGSVNHDRIWHLDAPLIPGRRLLYSACDVRLGGGGFHTGSRLLELGADVALISCLMQDGQGLSALETLREMGFDTRHVTMLPGETRPLEIFLEPHGERTILSFNDRRRPPFSTGGGLAGDAAYLNALLLDERLVAGLGDIPLVVSQLPLRTATPRPADYVITSRDDAGDDLPSIWRRAADLAGPRLKMLVLTDGPRRIALHDGSRTVLVDPAPAVEGVSMIGAGDCFSGAFLRGLLDGKDVASAAAEASRLTADWLRRRSVSR